MTRYLCAIAICAVSACAANAGDPDDLFALAAGHYERSEWDECSRLLEQLIRVDSFSPNAVEAFFYLGEARIQQRNLNAAQIAYQNFLVRQSNSRHVEKATFRLAEIEFLRDDPHGADLCDAFLRDYPASEWRPYALSYLGELRLIHDEPHLAQRAFEMALYEFPQHSLSDINRVGLAVALIRLGNHADAKRFLLDVTNRRRDSYGQRARLILATLEYHAGEFERAVGELTEIAANRSLEPSRVAEAYLWIARCHLALARYDQAADSYARAFDTGLATRFHRAANWEWATALLYCDRRALAQSKLETLLESGSNDEITEPALAAVIRLYYQDNQIEFAKKSIDRYLDSCAGGANETTVREINGRIAYDAGEFAVSESIFAKLLESKFAFPKQLASVRYLHALSLIGLEDFSAAADELMQVDIADLPVEAANGFYCTHGLALRAAGRFEESLAAYEKCLAGTADSSEKARARRELLLLAIQLDKFDVVQNVWEHFAQDALSVAGSEDLYRRVGDFAFRKCDWALATNCYQKLVASKDNFEDQVAGWAGLAWTALAESKYDEAQRRFEKLVSFADECPAAIEGYLPLADLQERTGDYKTAATTFFRAAERAANSEHRNIAQFKAAIALQKTGGENNLRQARQVLQDLQSSNAIGVPTDQLCYRLAWVEIDLRHDIESQKMFAAFLDQFPESDLWPDVAFRVAQSKFAQDDVVESGKLLDEILRREPPKELRDRARYVQAQIAARNGDWDRVETEMRDIATGTDDGDLKWRSFYWTAEAQYQMEKWSEAQVGFQEIAATGGKHEPTLEPWCWLRLTQSCAHLDQWLQALDMANWAREHFSEFALAYEFDLVRGRSLFALGRISEAIDAYRSVITHPAAGRCETAAQAQWRIGEAYFHKEDFPAAIAAFNRTESLYQFPKWRAAALLEAGKCQERLGNVTHAVKLYRQLLEKFPESELVEQAKKNLAALERRAQIPNTNR